MDVCCSEREHVLPRGCVFLRSEAQLATWNDENERLGIIHSAPCALLLCPSSRR